MGIEWTRKAVSDLTRLYDFLSPVNEAAAIRIVQSLSKAPTRLQDHPRLGEKLENFENREVRRLFISNYSSPEFRVIY